MGSVYDSFHMYSRPFEWILPIVILASVHPGSLPESQEISVNLSVYVEVLGGGHEALQFLRMALAKFIHP